MLNTHSIKNFSEKMVLFAQFRQPQNASYLVNFDLVTWKSMNYKMQSHIPITLGRHG